MAEQLSFPFNLSRPPPRPLPSRCRCSPWSCVPVYAQKALAHTFGGPNLQGIRILVTPHPSSSLAAGGAAESVNEKIRLASQSGWVHRRRLFLTWKKCFVAFSHSRREAERKIPMTFMSAQFPTLAFLQFVIAWRHGAVGMGGGVVGEELRWWVSLFSNPPPPPPPPPVPRCQTKPRGDGLQRWTGELQWGRPLTRDGARLTQL